MGVDLKKVGNIVRFVDVLVDANDMGNSLSAEDVDAFVQQAASMYPGGCTADEIEAAKRDVTWKYMIYTDPGKSILADYDEDAFWYDERKEEITPKFWTRYKNYLIDEKHFSPSVVSTLGGDTLDIKLMNYIGDPKADHGFLKRGLIIGDVQSGKTSTYIGFMCKAADAGYRVFILLTGTIESLRAQTQQRVEEGFIGIDMSADVTGGKRVGVGLDNKPIMARALTSRKNDFSSNIDKIAVSLGNSDAVVFVIKKQKNVLENLKNWLITLNADPVTKKIDIPMLLIDDEADNASINTKKDKEDPTVINRLIRELADVFTKSNYVGFTATPFANVFIDPETTEGMTTQDLFPEDFIVALPTPSNYIGPNKIFNENGEYFNQLVYIKDAGCTEEDGWPFYFKHDKEWKGQLPQSLTDALYTFYIANALRDLRGDGDEHRSMLVNISRFIKVQKYIKTQIEEIHSRAYNAIKFNLSHDLDEVLSDPVLARIYRNWEDHYNDTEFTWDQIVDVLFNAIEPIQIKVVNSSRSSEKLEYPKNESLRVIAIGGLALSRGLTLEGLIVSYFFRNTSTYDVLMQMGRWFGYRKNYEDLFRIWTSRTSAEWYAEIAEATDLLKHDMDIMREKKLKPRSFGIRVRNDSEELSITARNKMRATSDEYEFTDYFGDVFETPYLSANPRVNIRNFKAIESFADAMIACGHSMELVKGSGEHYMLRNIPKASIINLLSNITVSKYSARFDVRQLTEYLSSLSDQAIELWDVAFMDGSNKELTKEIAGKEIRLVERHKCSIEPSIDKLSLGRRGKLGGPTDGTIGICPEMIASAKKAFDSEFQQNNGGESFTGTYPSNTWFRFVKDRKPLLIIYLIDVRTEPGNNQSNQESEYLSKMQGYPTAGFALGLPRNDSAASKKIKYKVSTKYNYFELAQNIQESEEEE